MMKYFWRMGLVWIVVAIVGAGIGLHMLSNKEAKIRYKSIISGGSHFVSLMAIYPIETFSDAKRNFLLRTLKEYAADQGLAYFFVHDQQGDVVLSLMPDNPGRHIPGEVVGRSLMAMGLTRQEYDDDQSGAQICEFAKPIFNHGAKNGTVRAGYVLPRLPVFSPERISLTGLMLFLALSASVFCLYGVCKFLEPLATSAVQYLPQEAPALSSHRRRRSCGSLSVLFARVQQMIQALRGRVQHVEGENIKIAARLGVILFEKNQLTQILDTLKQGVIVTNVHDTVIFCNRYLLNLLNCKWSDAIDRPLIDVVRHKDLEAVLTAADVQGQAEAETCVDIILTPKGSSERFRVVAGCLRDHQGDPLGKLIVLYNITREASAQKATEEFIAHLAHELLTPLTTIKSYSEMLMEGDIDNHDTQIEFYNTINDETDRLTALIKDLLNLSKIEMGSLHLNKALMRTDWLFEDCLAVVEGTAEKKKIAIERVQPDNFPSLVGDKELLKVAVINVLGNAVKYTPPGGHIKFALLDQGTKVSLIVNDSGYGIEKQDLPHIFEKFYRSKHADIVSQGGTGLGLALTHQIISLHGGHIDAHSEVGQGTQFTITLPKEEYYLGDK